MQVDASSAENSLTFTDSRSSTKTNFRLGEYYRKKNSKVYLLQTYSNAAHHL